MLSGWCPGGQASWAEDPKPLVPRMNEMNCQATQPPAPLAPQVRTSSNTQRITLKRRLQIIIRHQAKLR